MVVLDTLLRHREDLTLEQILSLAEVFREEARGEQKDARIALWLCQGAEHSLRLADKFFDSIDDQTERGKVVEAYVELGNVLKNRGFQQKAEAIKRKSEMWTWSCVEHPTASTTTMGSSTDASALSPDQRGCDNEMIDPNIFPKDLGIPPIEFKPPEPDAQLDDTLQLARCLFLLKTPTGPEDELSDAARNWLEVTRNEPDEQERLKFLATDVIRAFKKDEFKDAKALMEVVYLAPVLEKDVFQYLLKEFYKGIDSSGLLDVHQVVALAQLIQGAGEDYIDADDLVKVLSLLSTRLKDTRKQSTHLHQLTWAISRVLDAVVYAKIKGFDPEKLALQHMDELKKSRDPYLVYQAAYAYQALLWARDNESTLQVAWNQTRKVMFGAVAFVKAVKDLNLPVFIKSLDNIYNGVAATTEIIHAAANAYVGTAALFESGKSFKTCLEKSFNPEVKCAWYPALRGADIFIRYRKLASFRRLIIKAPCRHDPAFQWGVCQRLGEIAADPIWDATTRRGAIAFLGEIYKKDDVWRKEVIIKQWILDILMRLSASSGESSQCSTDAGALFRDLEASDDPGNQDLYRKSQENGHVAYPLKIAQHELASPSLLDRVQNRPDVEAQLRVLRNHRTKERGNAVYIQTQAKSSLEDDDDKRFILMDEIKKFLGSNQEVFLILGDSGAGKSTFSRELEFDLWKSYERETGRIPLHINLPTINRPEIDMIAKQLKKDEFTDPQIRELKYSRKFILICDGYDESQQTHNLYMRNRLNQPNEWKAQMVISCRSEHLGSDYRDRFQPENRNQQLVSPLFQEAVITPFSNDQIDEYIDGYVSAKQPLWRVKDYKQALEQIPSLMDLVKNPFLMTLSLEVLPRMMDLGNLSTTRITRVTLYDHFVEQWLEREKKRLRDKDLTPQAKAAFDRLSAEGFILNGIEYIKRLAVAIYKEQDGHPVIEYSQLIDEGTWKDALFNQDHKQLLLQASP
ncbi:hypothetical protein BGX34_004888, partial [Mortierella sp. NVP85]